MTPVLVQGEAFEISPRSVQGRLIETTSFMGHLVGEEPQLAVFGREKSQGLLKILEMPHSDFFQLRPGTSRWLGSSSQKGP